MNLLDVFLWPEEKVFEEMAKELKEDPMITDGKNYAFWNRKSHMCLQAHIDVVSSSKYSYHGHFDQTLKKWVDDKEDDKNKKVKLVKCRNILWNKNGILGGDDRAGIMAMLSTNNSCIADKIDLPSILLTNGEENGGLGMKKFIEDIGKSKVEEIVFAPVRLILGLDRRGASEYVYYIEPPKEVKEYIESFGFTKELGSYSDSKDISVFLKIPSVNLSVGFYDNHTSRECIHIDETFLTARRVFKMLKDPIAQRYVPVIPSYMTNYTRNTVSGSRFCNTWEEDEKKDAKLVSSKELQIAKRRKRCDSLVVPGCFKNYHTYFPYLDYLLTDNAIREGFHVVSSPEEKGKTLEEWDFIFNGLNENDEISNVWKGTFGKYNKLYVKASGARKFFLAVQSPSTQTSFPSGILTIFSAANVEAKENNILQKMRGSIVVKVIEENKKNEVVDLSKIPTDPFSVSGMTSEDFLAANGYCKKFSQGCSGGCHGNRNYCDEVGGPDDGGEADDAFYGMFN
jgi:hypothetical protein